MRHGTDKVECVPEEWRERDGRAAKAKVLVLAHTHTHTRESPAEMLKGNIMIIYWRERHIFVIIMEVGCNSNFG